MPALHRLTGRWAMALCVAAGFLLPHGAARSAEFHLFLRCEGSLSSAGKSRAAHLDLALRDNNTTALIQRSNVLPVGERLLYTPTPMHYSMVFKLGGPGSRVYLDWVRGTWVIWQPNLKRLATIRLAIDRQDGALEGELRDLNDDVIGTIEMNCSAVDPESLPPPKL